MPNSHYGWVLYRTTQFREDFKCANIIKDPGNKLTTILNLWKEFQMDLINFYETKENLE